MTEVQIHALLDEIVNPAELESLADRVRQARVIAKYDTAVFIAKYVPQQRGELGRQMSVLKRRGFSARHLDIQILRDKRASLHESARTACRSRAQAWRDEWGNVRAHIQRARRILASSERLDALRVEMTARRRLEIKDAFDSLDPLLPAFVRGKHFFTSSAFPFHAWLKQCPDLRQYNAPDCVDDVFARLTNKRLAMLDALETEIGSPP